MTTENSALATVDLFHQSLAAAIAITTRFARTLVGADDASDVVQEALAQAWRKRARYDPAKGSLVAWVLGFVAKEAQRAQRRRTRHGPILDDELIAASTHLSTDLRLDLRAAINGLPRRQRETIIEFYYVGLGVKEIAELNSVQPGTVSSNLNAARAALRRKLGANYAVD